MAAKANRRSLRGKHSAPRGGSRSRTVVGASAYLTLTELAGKRMHPEALIAMVRKVDWRDGLDKVAELSSRLTWSRTDLHHDMLAVARPTLVQWNISPHKLDSVLAEHPDWTLVTEQGLLSLAAMFVLYGGETGIALSDQLCSILILGLHDYVDDWETTS